MRVQLPSHTLNANLGNRLKATGRVPGNVEFMPERPFDVPSTGWSLLSNGPMGTVAGTTLNGQEFAIPFLPSFPVLKALAIDVSGAGSAGAAVRLGIRANVNGAPGALLADAGSQATTSTGIISYTLGTPLALGDDWLFYTVTFQGAPTTGATVRTHTIGDPRFPIYGTGAPAANSGYWGYYQTGVTGALPAGFTPAGFTQVPIRVFGQAN